MQATTLNINVNIPHGNINIGELKRQVTVYAQFIANHFASTKPLSRKRFSSLKGVLKEETMKTDKELLDEYLTEKYGL